MLYLQCPAKSAFVEYGGAMYRYVHNLQGDIVAIVDANGNAVVEYKYDAWGKSIDVVADTGIGAINPFGIGDMSGIPKQIVLIWKGVIII